MDISIGRSKRIAPNFILGALVDATGMSGRDFGKIDIYDEHTTVEVPESELDYIIDSTDSIRINGHQVQVKAWKGVSLPEKKQKYSRRDDKPKFDRKRSAYGSRKRSDVFSDYIPDRKKRSKKRH